MDQLRNFGDTTPIDVFDYGPLIFESTEAELDKFLAENNDPNANIDQLFEESLGLQQMPKPKETIPESHENTASVEVSVPEQSPATSESLTAFDVIEIAEDDEQINDSSEVQIDESLIPVLILNSTDNDESDKDFEFIAPLPPRKKSKPETPITNLAKLRLVNYKGTPVKCNSQLLKKQTPPRGNILNPS